MDSEWKWEAEECGKKKGHWQAAFLKSLQLIKADAQYIQEENAEAPRFTLCSDVRASPQQQIARVSDDYDVRPSGSWCKLPQVHACCGTKLTLRAGRGRQETR